ncbi:uncharacterized protein FSUBG_13668 [Fusarium subglutinans]|uniref:Uncharacterized protein n=1 Tax=Gibberella subglutinans TaxID=42677 RepID=A0A8H5KUF9_GIBSU|nr:uncharacterized protein FSUBG_13668 [Fusarium subglutinans]KAF5579018.1 hypothetical protein FSUBG_13668 [Fusarium subglutinans]
MITLTTDARIRTPIAATESTSNPATSQAVPQQDHETLRRLVGNASHPRPRMDCDPGSQYWSVRDFSTGG